MFRVLRTNGGRHPPEKLAVFTAEELFQVDGQLPGTTALVANPDGDRALAARRVQTAIAEALEGHHGAAIESERSALAASADRFAEPIDVTDRLDAAVRAAAAPLAGTPWADWLTPEREAAWRAVLRQHLGIGPEVERQWHAHEHPELEAGRAFLRLRHPPLEERIAAKLAEDPTYGQDRS